MRLPAIKLIVSFQYLFLVYHTAARDAMFPPRAPGLRAQEEKTGAQVEAPARPNRWTGMIFFVLTLHRFLGKG